MSDPRDPNRRVQLPEAGEGVYLLLKNRDIRRLQNEVGTDWLLQCERACTFYHGDILDKMLKVMTWRDDKPLGFGLDDIGDDIVMEELSGRLLDAVTLAVHGRAFKEQVAYLLEKQKEGDENPPKSPVTSSSASSAEPTGQVSNPSSSTT